jgi:hypothetical protein
MPGRGSKEARRKSNFHIYLSIESFGEIGKKKNTIETRRVVEGRKNKNTYFITLQRMLENVAARFSENKSYLHSESRYV